MWRGTVDSKCAAGKSGVLPKFKGFVGRGITRRNKEKKSKGVARPAIVEEKPLKAFLFDFGLLVCGGGRRGRAIVGITQAGMIRLGTSQNRIDERRGGRAKIQRRERATVRGFRQDLILGRGEHKFIDAVAVIIQGFEARSNTARSVAVGDGLGANQIAGNLGAKMGSIVAAKDSVPISVVAMRTMEQIAGRGEFVGGFRTGSAFGRSGNTAGDPQHFFVHQVRFRVLAEKPAPRAAAKEREHLGSW